MAELEKLNINQLTDLKNGVEREFKRREGGLMIPYYHVLSCISDVRYFRDINCALRCLKQLSEQLHEYINEDPENLAYVNKCTGIVGVTFRVKEMTEIDFNIRIEEKYFDDICFPPPDVKEVSHA
ncbi:TPA: DUF5448 family protein [Yersinia enterocolitica]